MHLITGGPSIPNDVLAAREDGTLALVCGAGISKLNGLPLFGELVRRVWDELGPASLPIGAPQREGLRSVLIKL